MASDSYPVHLRTLTFLSAGAAFLAVIGYFFMQSDRKKPKRKSSEAKINQETDSIQLANNIAKFEHLDNIIDIKANEIEEAIKNEEILQCNDTLDKSVTDEDAVVPDDSIETPTDSATSSGFSSLHKFDEKQKCDNDIESSSSIANNQFIDDSEALGNKISEFFEKSETSKINEPTENNTNSEYIESKDKELAGSASPIPSDSNKGECTEEISHKNINKTEEITDNIEIVNIKDTTIVSEPNDIASSNNQQLTEFREEEIKLDEDTTINVDQLQAESSEQAIIKPSSTDKTQNSTQGESLAEINRSSKERIKSVEEISENHSVSSSSSLSKRNKKRNDSKRSRNSTSISSVSSSICSNTKNSPKKNNKNLSEQIFLDSDKFKQINTDENGDAAEVEDLVVYEFNFPRKLCGKLIGKNGVHVDYIRSKTQTQIAVRNDAKINDLQVVCVSGRISDVDKALDIIGHRFPSKLYPQISFKPISKPIVYRRFNKEKSSTPTAEIDQSKILVASTNFVEFNDDKENPNNGPISVQVTAIVNAGHVFVQLPKNSTYTELQNLDKNMLITYDNMNELVPNMNEPIEFGTICAAPTSYGWHRAMITNYRSFEEVKLQLADYNEMCGLATVKFLDYGGYLNIPVNQLRQLRSDFMVLPFQGIECYLEGCWNTNQNLIEEGRMFLNQQIKDSFTEALVAGYTEDGIPLIRLFISNNSVQHYCLNDELSKLGLVINNELNSMDTNYNQSNVQNIFNPNELSNPLTNEINAE